MVIGQDCLLRIPSADSSLPSCSFVACSSASFLLAVDRLFPFFPYVCHPFPFLRLLRRVGFSPDSKRPVRMAFLPVRPTAASQESCLNQLPPKPFQSPGFLHLTVLGHSALLICRDPQQRRFSWKASSTKTSPTGRCTLFLEQQILRRFFCNNVLHARTCQASCSACILLSISETRPLLQNPCELF